MNNAATITADTVTVYTLEAKTFSKKSVKEIVAITPEAKTYKIKFVGGFGNVIYIKNEAGQTIGHVSKVSGSLQFSVKN
mgnify:CR=1 FL=1